MICVGDFNQLGAVRKDFVPTNMVKWAHYKQTHEPATNNKTNTPTPKPHKRTLQEMNQKLKTTLGNNKANRSKHTYLFSKYAVGKLCEQGCQLFSKFERIHLTHQQRSDDPEHTEFVTTTAKVNKIDINNLKIYSALSKEDMKDKSWRYAPVLVSTNRERLHIARTQARNFAKEHKTYVFKWKCHLSAWKNRPPSEELHQAEEGEPFFWQYWVKGAQAYLTTNINTSLGLANGTPVVLHSLAYDNEQMIDEINSILYHGAREEEYGSEITLDTAPTMINVEVLPALDGKPPSSHRKRQLRYLRKQSIDPTKEKIIIPVAHWKEEEGHKHKFTTTSFLTPVAQVTTKTVIPFELAFSMTVHKAQGRTIDKVILALDKRATHQLQLDFPAFFVAISQVKKRSDLRLLNPGPENEQAFINSYSYLEHLTPSKDITIFYSGYVRNNGIWNPKKAMKNYF